MGNIVNIDFHGDRLLGIETERGAFVYLKPVVERLGLDWSAQYRRVKRDPTLREGVAIMAIPPEHGGPNDAVFLQLDLFHGWLFTVDAARVKAELRERFVTYQRECYAVLSQAFARPREPERVRPLIPDETMSPRLAKSMVTEVRHTFGEYAARQMWFKLNLPIVPAMHGAPYQSSLFEYQAHPAQGGR